jgi:ATP-dependent helicase HrpA
VVKNRQPVEEVREAWRRSAGKTPRLGQAELTAWYEREIASTRDIQEWRSVRAVLDPDDFVPRAQRLQLMALPGAAEVRGRTVPIDYDVEETTDGALGVARLRLPEKVARNLVDEELPDLDRPVRFMVTRGARGSVKAATLTELQERLDEPFTDDERSGARVAERNSKSESETERGRRGGPGRGVSGREGSGGRGGDSRGGDSRGGGSRGGDDRSRPGGRPWKGPGGGDPAGGGRHRPGSPSGRGKRRGK